MGPPRGGVNSHRNLALHSSTTQAESAGAPRFFTYEAKCNDSANFAGAPRPWDSSRTKRNATNRQTQLVCPPLWISLNCMESRASDESYDYEGWAGTDRNHTPAGAAARAAEGAGHGLPNDLRIEAGRSSQMAGTQGGSVGGRRPEPRVPPTNSCEIGRGIAGTSRHRQASAIGNRKASHRGPLTPPRSEQPAAERQLGSAQLSSWTIDRCSDPC
jgi:hypothetical protein